MNEKAKLQPSAGMSSAIHGSEHVSVRDLLRRKAMQKELARRGHRMVNAVPVCRQQG
jgi:hypothetical protein